jgi:hypothetical protein
MQRIRTAGCVSGPDELGLLFKGLEGLESLVGAVRETGEAPAPDDALMALLDPPAEPAVELAGDSSKKKVLS